MRLSRSSFPLISLLVIGTFLSASTGLLPSAHAASSPVVGVWSNACGSFNLTVSSCPTGTLTVGSTITVQINVTGTVPFNAFETALYYDPSMLNATSIDFTGSPAFGTQTVWTNPFPVVSSTNTMSGAVFISMANLGQTLISTDGILANINFTVKALGVSPLTLAAGTADPSFSATSLKGTKVNWTRLVQGPSPVDTATADGYFMNEVGKRGPVAVFASSPSQPLVGQSVFFNASQSYDLDLPSLGSSEIAHYHWDFGDGSSGLDAPIVSHIFGPPAGTPYQGNFSVRLTVVDSDDGFQGMITHIVDIIPPSSLPCATGPILRVPQDCSSIQSAINSVSNGGTVSVSGGTYLEDPIIEKSVNLIATGTGTAIISGVVRILRTSNATLSGFTIMHPLGTTGVLVDLNRNSSVHGNEIVGPSQTSFQESQGILVSNSGNVSLTGNTVVNETFGVLLQSSRNTILRGNTIAHNQFNFGVQGSYIQDIDPSNTVDGKPILYDVNGNIPNLPANPGYIGIINSHDLAVGHASISNEDESPLIVNCTRVTVTGVAVQTVNYGAVILNSTSVTLTESSIRAPLQMNGDIANIIVKNTFSGSYDPLVIEDSARNLIENNTIPAGVLTIIGSTMNQVVSNMFPAGGVELGNSPNNVLTGNQVQGLAIVNSPNNLLRNNAVGYEGGIVVRSGHIACLFGNSPCMLESDYVQDIDPSNTMLGKPIYYLVNKNDFAVPSNAGFVAVVNSTNILVSHVNIAYNIQDVVIVYSNDVTVQYSNLTNVFGNGVFAWSDSGLVLSSNSFYGDRTAITIESSNRGAIVGNNIQRGNIGMTLSDTSSFDIQGNYVTDFSSGGIVFRDFTNFNGPSGAPSSDNIIERNTVTYDTNPNFLAAGITASPNTLVVGNTIADNTVGLVAGLNDTIYQNNFINNYYRQAGGSQDRWDNGSGQGNYWSDYTGQDTDNDGVGDTLLPHNGLDSYPLMAPWTPTGLAAKMTGRAAWPEYRRLSISRAGETQTLFALANDTGTAPEWVQAVFNITSATGYTIQLVSAPVWVNPGSQTTLSVTLPANPGSYRVTVTLRYSSDAFTRWTPVSPSKNFSFTVVP